jgi:hypothetical protein
LSYQNLQPHLLYYTNVSFTPARTLPWRYGAPWCKLYKMLKDGTHHKLKLPPDDLARLMLWMDTNAQFFGHEIDVQGQSDGKVVWPPFN